MTRRTSIFLALIAAVAGCAADAGLSDDPSLELAKDDTKADSSAFAVFRDFEMDAEFLTASSWSPESSIQEQLLYTIGHLNADRSVARLDHLRLTNVQVTPEGGKYRVRYHVKLLVAWGDRNAIPTDYTFRLPLDMSGDALEAFATKYGHSCVDYGAHEVDSNSMWYYFRPRASGCNLEASDVIEAHATVTPSGVQTSGKYPEYDQVWRDSTLRAVAIFGKYEDGATTASDAGISAYNEFLRAIRTRLSAYSPTTVPATVPNNPGVSVADVTFRATLPDGKSIEVVALLVDNVRTAGATFDARYASLSSNADFIVYNGHAGLGANIRALARKGRWVAGQYVLVFMNGCDTYAYVDSALGDAHRAVNPDDSTGTKYVDIMMNGMPAYFASDSEATMAVIDGLLSYDEPRTFERMMENIDSAQVVLVSGEQDNVFVPGGGGGGGGGGGAEPWDGLNESGTLAARAEKRWETPRLAPGRYVFDMTGTGDADLYVRTGQAPTTTSYDCRPYKSSSNESCAVDLPVEGVIHVMARGYARATYTLVGHTE